MRGQPAVASLSRNSRLLHKTATPNSGKAGTMTDWVFAQTDSSEELARLHYFSFKKRQGDMEVEFVITVREYAERNKQHMKFFAQADKQVNQKTLPCTPFGWGETALDALSECFKMIRRYSYEG